MTAYAATLVNETSSVWTLVVYVTIPNAATMLSVAWQVSPGVAPSGSNGVTWTDGASVCLGTLSTSTGVSIFRQNLARAAAPNQGWTVTNNGSLDLTLTGPSITPGQIEVTNSAGQLTNIALGYSSTAAVYAAGIASGLAVGFIPTPRYWALITQSSVAQGQVVAYATPTNKAQVAGTFVPPFAFDFPSNETAATITLSMNGNSVSVITTYAST